MIFNWPASGTPWDGGTPASGQTASDTFTSVNPNDITASINNSGAGPESMNFNASYPAIGRQLFTGGFSNVNGLQIELTTESSSAAYVQFTVSFAYGVTNLSFQIWDLDEKGNQFTDVVSHLQGLSIDGVTLVGASSVTSEQATFNSITGTGLSTVITGLKQASNNSNQGTVDITFNQPITQFSFQYSNTDPALGQQGLALGPLTYDIVPESNSVLSVTACLLSAILVETCKRRRRASPAD